MNLKERTDKLFHKKGNPEEKTIRTIVSLMEYFHWSWDEVMSIPIPAFNEICSEVNSIEEEKEKKMKKKTLGKR